MLTCLPSGRRDRRDVTTGALKKMYASTKLDLSRGGCDGLVEARRDPGSRLHPFRELTRPDEGAEDVCHHTEAYEDRIDKNRTKSSR